LHSKSHRQLYLYHRTMHLFPQKINFTNVKKKKLSVCSTEITFFFSQAPPWSSTVLEVWPCGLLIIKDIKQGSSGDDNRRFWTGPQRSSWCDLEFWIPALCLSYTLLVCLYYAIISLFFIIRRFCCLRLAINNFKHDFNM
jgi:hypothetical protein